MTSAVGQGLAQPIDPASRITARKLGAEAIALFDKGEYAVALEKFELANQLVPSPTLALRAARCLVKLGRLVEASERYTEATRMKLDASAQLVQRKAQVEALKEREKLTPRIPSLEVVIEGPQGKGVTVTLDGKTLSPALLGQKQPVDPGKHELEAQRADTKVRREVELAEGEEARLALKLPPLPVPPPPPVPPSPLPMYGWISVGVGAAGIVVGAANGVAAMAQQGSLVDRCPDRRCPPDAHGDADLYDVTRKISTIGFIAGGVIAAGGVTLLLIAPDEPAPAPLTASAPPRLAPRAAVYITLGGAGARGFF
jgi:hypothetical protein